STICGRWRDSQLIPTGVRQRVSMLLPHDSALYFRDQLRAARAAALRDAEGFEELLFTFERLGSYLHKSQAALGTYEARLREVASSAPAWTVLQATDCA